MNKFKSGDKVRCIKSSSDSSLREDNIYTVKCYWPGATSTLEVTELPGLNWFETRFELVSPEKEELQSLLDRANDGLRAERELRDKYPYVSVRFSSGDVISIKSREIDWTEEYIVDTPEQILRELVRLWDTQSSADAHPSVL